MLSAIGCTKHDGRAFVRVGMTPAANDPAIAIVHEGNRFQAARDWGRLQSPVPTSVVGVPDDTAITYRPTKIRIDKCHVRQFGVEQRLVWKPQRCGDGSNRLLSNNYKCH
jgi:hypothetical protein